MFDNIGRDLDEEAARRRATSLFLTTGGCCAVLGLVLGVATYTAVDVLTEPVIEDRVVWIDDALPDDDTPLPAAPPPPSGGGDEAEDPAEPEVPDELVDEVRELNDEIEERIVDAAKPPGTSGDDGPGDPKVPGGGTERCTVPPCGGGPPVQVFHHSELEVRRRVNPDYPDAARAMAMGDQRCVVTVFIDPSGVPYDASVDRCPKVFHDASREAILKWRWYPPKDGKSRIRAQTTIAITYRLD